MPAHGSFDDHDQGEADGQEQVRQEQISTGSGTRGGHWPGQHPRGLGRDGSYRARRLREFGPAGRQSDARTAPPAPRPPGRHWKATKVNYLLGKDGKPVVSHDITVRVQWIKKTGGRFLKEQTQGTLAGHPYYRLGIMGYSNIDRRYEWTTFDSVTPTAMTYRGAPDSGSASEISIPGEFTDPGILGPEYLGKTIPIAHRLQDRLPRPAHRRPLLHPARPAGTPGRPCHLHPEDRLNAAPEPACRPPGRGCALSCERSLSPPPPPPPPGRTPAQTDPAAHRARQRHTQRPTRPRTPRSQDPRRCPGPHRTTDNASSPSSPRSGTTGPTPHH